MSSKDYCDEKEQLAKIIRSLREQSNMSQRQLSEKTGICQADISKIERGMANPSLSTIVRIFSATGAKLNFDYRVNNTSTGFEVESWGNVQPRIRELSKTSVAMLKKALKDDLNMAILFGSCARGENGSDSDVDIALLTNCNQIDSKKYDDVLASVANRIMDGYCEVVNFICLPYSDFCDKKEWYPFYHNIDKEGVVIYAKR